MMRQTSLAAVRLIGQATTRDARRASPDDV